MRYRLISHDILVALAASYIAVSVVDTSKATSVIVWLPYIIATLILVNINLRKEYCERRRS